MCIFNIYKAVPILMCYFVLIIYLSIWLLTLNFILQWHNNGNGFRFHIVTLDSILRWK